VAVEVERLVIVAVVVLVRMAGLKGFVHEAALAEVANLESHEVYAAGPPAMTSITVT